LECLIQTASGNLYNATVNTKQYGTAPGRESGDEEEEEEEEIYLPQTITILNQKNTILMLARSRLPEKQKAIYAGRQHC